MGGTKIVMTRLPLWTVGVNKNVNVVASFLVHCLFAIT